MLLGSRDAALTSLTAAVSASFAAEKPEECSCGASMPVPELLSPFVLIFKFVELTAVVSNREVSEGYSTGT